jgi:hypothetical protein
VKETGFYRCFLGDRAFSPPHYAFLLIIEEMASSPFLKPSRDVCGGVVDRAVLDT